MKNNRIMKLAMAVICMMTMVFLTACGSTNQGGTAPETTPEVTPEVTLEPTPEVEEREVRPLQIVTTTFAQYDWIREILGELGGYSEIKLLAENGVDLHSFQPSAQDIIAITSADLFVYGGGESDEWVEDVFANVASEEVTVVNLLEVIGDRRLLEEVVEGMEEDHDHDHSHEDEDDHEDDHDEDGVYDEHVWLSLKNASVIVDYLGEVLGELDTANEDVYVANAKAYMEELAALDVAYEEVTSTAARNTLIFGDRFPFRYLFEDYNLEYYAAFVGCSAETEASFETVVFLANKVDELMMPVVMMIDNGNEKLAQTVVNSTTTSDQTIATLHSLQSITSNSIGTGVTYLSVMEENLQVLKEVLN